MTNPTSRSKAWAYQDLRLTRHPITGVGRKCKVLLRDRKRLGTWVERFLESIMYQEHLTVKQVAKFREIWAMHRPEGTAELSLVQDGVDGTGLQGQPIEAASPREPRASLDGETGLSELNGG